MAWPPLARGWGPALEFWGVCRASKTSESNAHGISVGTHPSLNSKLLLWESKIHKLYWNCIAGILFLFVRNFSREHTWFICMHNFSNQSQISTKPAGANNHVKISCGCVRMCWNYTNMKCSFRVRASTTNCIFVIAGILIVHSDSRPALWRICFHPSALGA